MAARAGMGRGAHPAVHHLLDQAMHVGYGAALGAAYGLALDPRAGTHRSAHLGARGAAYGLATWLFGSWLLLPSLRAKQAPWRKRASENAVDLAAHLLFGAVTALVTEEMRAQPDRGPSSDEHRRATAIG